MAASVGERATPVRATGRRGSGTSRGGWATVAAGLLGLLALAGWSQWQQAQAPVLVGSEVEHDGGTFVVRSAWTTGDPMMAMMPDNDEQFAGAGMEMMSSMISDAVPEGAKRVAVEVVVRAGADPMSLPVSEVRLRAGDVLHEPYTVLLGDGSLAAGEQISGVAVFEVPSDTTVAQFHLAEDARAVDLDVTGGPGGGPGHDDMDH
jgi:hypothetical protein